MSDKNELVEQALDDSKEIEKSEKSNKELISEKLDKINSKKELDLASISVPCYGFSRSSLCSDRKLFKFTPKSVVYPPSPTDQTHVLSISEQVRRGQGDAKEPDGNDFDFPDGKDDGSEAHGVFEFAERVDLWLAEQKLSDDLRASFRKQVLQRQADKAMSESISEAKEKTEIKDVDVQDSPSEVKK